MTNDKKLHRKSGPLPLSLLQELLINFTSDIEPSHAGLSISFGKSSTGNRIRIWVSTSDEAQIQFLSAFGSANSSKNGIVYIFGRI